MCIRDSGQEVADLKEKERTRVRKGKLGFVFQSLHLIDELNVYENVELPLTYLGVKASERKRMVDVYKRQVFGNVIGNGRSVVGNFYQYGFRFVAVGTYVDMSFFILSLIHIW